MFCLERFDELRREHLVPRRERRHADDMYLGFDGKVGGVIPRQDYQFLLDRGVAAVFGLGTNVLDAARAVPDLLEGKRRNQ